MNSTGTKPGGVLLTFAITVSVASQQAIASD
jgi:hypothetical protein